MANIIASRSKREGWYCGRVRLNTRAYFKKKSGHIRSVEYEYARNHTGTFEAIAALEIKAYRYF